MNIVVVFNEGTKWLTTNDFIFHLPLVPPIEWANGDVVRIIQTQLKQSATLAAIFFLYAISALRFGFSLRLTVSSYEIDYV